MKLSKKEREFVLRGRKRMKVIKNSRKIIALRKKSQLSTGEKRISEFLIKEAIEFKREYFFFSCYSPKTQQLLYFDFYIPEFNLCIEYDGEQHYDPNKTENQKINDFTKNAYCLKNGIDLLRIKYDQLERVEMIICKKVDAIEARRFKK